MSFASPSGGHHQRRSIALAVHQSAPRPSMGASVQQVIDAVHQFRLELDSTLDAVISGAVVSDTLQSPSFASKTPPALLLFSELFLGGYGSGPLVLTSDTATITPPIGAELPSSLAFEHSTYHGAQWLEPIRQACKDSRVGIVCGYSERAEALVPSGTAHHYQTLSVDTTASDLSVSGVDNVVKSKHIHYNAAMVIDDTGVVLASYRKVHLWGGYEGSIFTAADNLLAGRFVFHGIQCGVLICFDVEFPESTRALRLDGVDVAFVPTALANAFNARVTVPSRAFENNFVVCYANEIGQDPNLPETKYCGLSVVALPDGTEGCRCAPFPAAEDVHTLTHEGSRSAAPAPSSSSSKKRFEYCVIDLEDEAFTTARERNNYLPARRPECYAKN